MQPPDSVSGLRSKPWWSAIGQVRLGKFKFGRIGFQNLLTSRRSEICIGDENAIVGTCFRMVIEVINPIL